MEEWNEWFGDPIGYGSVAEAAGEGSTSPEVAAARQEALGNEFLNQIHKKRQAADQQNNQIIESVRNTIISMNQNGNSKQDIFNYLSNMRDMNPTLAHSGTFQNLMLNYSTIPKTSSGSSGTGQAVTKMSALDIRDIEALIGNRLNSQDDLSEFIYDQVSKGRVFSDSTIVSLQGKMDDYEHGTGKYAIKIETSKAEVAASMGINSKDISDMDYNVAKSQTQEWAIQYNNENGRYPSQVEVQKYLQSELQMDRTGGTDYTSRAKMGAAGIEYILRAPADSDGLREVKFHDNGKVYVLTDMEVNAILEGRATQSEADDWDTENRRS